MLFTSKPNVMPTRYENFKKLGSYLVTKDLVHDIEDYCNRQIPKLIDIKKPQVDEMAVTIHTRKNRRVYNSIREYKNDIASHDIISIAIDCSLYDETRGIVLSIRFDKSADDSFLQICVYDDRVQTILSTIQPAILNILNNYKTKHRYRYSPESIAVPFLILVLMICVFGIMMGGKGTKAVFIIIGALDIFYLVAFRNTNTNCTFDLKNT
jgi:hypothetical protein